MRICDACGNPKASNETNKAMLCPDCAVDVKTEIKKLRQEGKPVNALHIAKKLLKENHRLSDIRIRDIPEDFKKTLQHRATDEGISLRELHLIALYQYLGQID